MTDQCDADFSELDRDQLVQLCNDMHNAIHVYADNEDRLTHFIAGLGYGLDGFAEELAKANRLGNRKEALAQAAGRAANFATIAYRVIGITRDDVQQAVEFSEIVDQFDAPSYNKD